MKKSVMIFGISSFVGSNLAEHLKNDFRIIGTYYSLPVEIPGVISVQCDVLKKDYVNRLVAIFKPDIIIYAVGVSSLQEAKLRPNLAEALNTGGAANCSMASERYGTKMIFLSSAFVLGGQDLDYKESDTPFPYSDYGKSIASGEFYIQRSCLNYLILRCCPLYGRSYNPNRPNVFDGLQKSFSHNQSVVADNTVTTGYLDVVVLARVIKALIDANVTNRLLQVSSKDSMTKYNFADLYSRVFKKDQSLIQKTAMNFPYEDKSTAPRVAQHFFKLDTTNVEEFLGTPMPKVEESLLFTNKRLLYRN
jgi:dTDP-4-dehydrorhamnose reductase